MEQFKLLEGTDTLKDSREILNNNLLSVRSLSSGTAFPTDNLSEGMLCYRTDLKKLYQYQADGSWSADITMSISGNANTANSAGTATNAEHADTADRADTATTAGTCTGNSATATALQTSRTINGVHFNGTNNIVIDVGVKKINGVAADSTGNVAIGDYVKNISINGQTITVTYKNNSTQTLTTQDTAPYTASATAIGSGTGGASNTTPAVVVSSSRSGTEWYRKYSDGWIEQGGFTTGSGYNDTTILLQTPFTTTEYTAIAVSGSGDRVGDSTTSTHTLTTTNFKSYQHGSHRWYACGV